MSENQKENKKLGETWKETKPDALPNRSSWFNKMRTNAYTNNNLTHAYVEFFTAFQTDKKEDKWQVMGYAIVGINEPNSKIQTKILKEDVSFLEAVSELAAREVSMDSLSGTTHNIVNLSQEDYTGAKLHGLNAIFFDTEFYKDASAIEGLVFDRSGYAHRRVLNQIFTEGTFPLETLGREIALSENPENNPHIEVQVEGGILSDIFNSRSKRKASYDNILKVMEVFSHTDPFVQHIATVYAAAQHYLDMDVDFKAIEGLSAEKREALEEKVKPALSVIVQKSQGVGDTLMAAEQCLDRAEAAGAHVEPYRKFVLECQLFIDLLRASENLKLVEAGFENAGSMDPEMILSIKTSVATAEAKYKQLGGSDEFVDRLKAWVADTEKENIPKWLPKFIDHYYTARETVTQRVKARKEGVKAEANLMSTKVKPPIYNP